MTSSSELGRSGDLEGHNGNPGGSDVGWNLLRDNLYAEGKKEGVSSPIQEVPQAHTSSSLAKMFSRVSRSVKFTESRLPTELFLPEQDAGIELVTLNPKKDTLTKLASRAYNMTPSSLKEIKTKDFVNPRLELFYATTDQNHIIVHARKNCSIIKKFSFNKIIRGDETLNIDKDDFIKNKADPMINRAQEHLKNAQQQVRNGEISHEDLLSTLSELRRDAVNLSQVHALRRELQVTHEADVRQASYDAQAPQRAKAKAEWTPLKKAGTYLAFGIPATLMGTPVSMLWEQPKEETTQERQWKQEKVQRIPLKHAQEILFGVRSRSQQNIDKIAAFCTKNNEELMKSSSISSQKLKEVVLTIDKMKIAIQKASKHDTVKIGRDNTVTMNQEEMMDMAKDLSQKNAELTQHWIKLHKAISNTEAYDPVSIKAAHLVLDDKIRVTTNLISGLENMSQHDTNIHQAIEDAELRIREASKVSLREEVTVKLLKKHCVKMEEIADSLRDAFIASRNTILSKEEDSAQNVSGRLQHSTY